MYIDLQISKRTETESYKDDTLRQMIKNVLTAKSFYSTQQYLYNENEYIH